MEQDITYLLVAFGVLMIVCGIVIGMYELAERPLKRARTDD